MFEQTLDAYTFLKTIHGDNCFEIRLIQDAKGKTVAHPESIIINRDIVYSGKNKTELNKRFISTESLQEIIEVLNSYSIMGVFFTPNSPNFDKMNTCTASDNDIEKVVCQFVDIDSPEEIRKDQYILSSWKQQKIDILLSHQVKPSIIVDTKNGIHAYYLLLTPGDKELYKKVQLQLVQYFDGDEACVNLSRVMRLPFFNHVKKPKDPYLISVIHWNPTDKYEQGYLARTFPPLSDEHAKKIIKKPTKSTTKAKPKKLTDPVSEGSVDNSNHKIIELVKAHLEISSEKPDKLTCRCCLPEHPDSNPSAWFDKEKLWYHCSGCGASLPLSELAKVMEYKDVLECYS